jgi:Protein of unknown function (DUF3723)
MRMLSGKIFPAIKDKRKRKRTQIFDRLRSITHVVRSIDFLEEDAKRLVPCVKILKELLPSKCESSISLDLWLEMGLRGL